MSTGTWTSLPTPFLRTTLPPRPRSPHSALEGASSRAVGAGRSRHLRTLPVPPLCPGHLRASPSPRGSRLPPCRHTGVLRPGGHPQAPSIGTKSHGTSPGSAGGTRGGPSSRYRKGSARLGNSPPQQKSPPAASLLSGRRKRSASLGGQISHTDPAQGKNKAV